MDSFIIIDKCSSSEVVSTIASILRERAEKRIRIVNAEDSSALKRAVLDLGKQDGRITLISSEIDLDVLKHLVSTAEGRSDELVILKSLSDFEGYELYELSPENLINSIHSNLINVSSWISASSELLTEIQDGIEVSFEELSIMAVIEGLCRGIEIREIPAEIRSEPHSVLSSAQISSLLLFTLSRCNIEELFPNQAWDRFQAESLAFCYHTLATIFMKLGNLNAAKECLNVSERYEDSPRLLALRGIIASTEGRDLEAVAHLVTSLQQYEARKVDDGQHYIKFSPTNLELINSELKEGLNALNEKDNIKAYQCFSKAIFNFDSFFENG